MEASDLFIAMAVIGGKPILGPSPTRPFEPTFYLGGQPYLVDVEELLKAGPQLAEMALFETYRQMWATHAEYRQGGIDKGEYEHRMAEMGAGACALREMVPDLTPLFPNGGFVTKH